MALRLERLRERHPKLLGNLELLTAVEEIEQLGAHEAIAVDTETTSQTKYGVIRGVSLKYGDRNFYVPISHPESVNVSRALAHRLGEALTVTPARHVYHNATYDWHYLDSIGMQPPLGRYFDTQVFSWLVDENVSHKLKDQGAMYFGFDEKAEKLALDELFRGKPAKFYKDLVKPGVRKGKMRVLNEWAKEMAERSKTSWEHLTAEEIVAYAAKDTELTMRLMEAQLADDYGPTDPCPAVQRALDLQETVYRIMQRGVRVDLDRVERTRNAYLERMAEIEPEFQGINLNSTKQLGNLIYNEWGLPVRHRTPSGNPATHREALEELAGEHPLLDLLLEYRMLSKAVGTYFNNMLEYADSNNRIHTNFCTTCTKTGRFSSSEPNLQNIPREATSPEVKKVFMPEPGFELWEYDLQSAELFVGASIANDDDMMAALTEEGRDFHTETAMGVFGTAEGNYRTLAKNLNYGIPYGIGPRKFATYLVKGSGKPVSNREIKLAKSIIAKHKQLWPKTHRAIKRLERFADVHHYVPLHVPGRYRHFRSPGIWVPSYTAFNAVVQGGVAEVMVDIMLAVEHELERIGARLVLQVHDSLWVEQPPGISEQVRELIQSVTDDINPFRMRLLWDAKQLGLK